MLWGAVISSNPASHCLPVFACSLFCWESRVSQSRACATAIQWSKMGDSADAMWHNTWKTLHMRQRGAATYSHVVQIASSHNSLAKIHYALCCGWTHCHLQRFSKKAFQFEKTDNCSWFCLFKLLSCNLWEVFNWSDVILIRLALCFHSYNVSWYLFARKQNEHNFWYPSDGGFSPHWLTVRSFLAAKAKEVVPRFCYFLHRNT